MLCITLSLIGYFEEPVNNGHISDARLNEISGMASSRRHDDILYVLNDSGGQPRYASLTSANIASDLSENGTKLQRSSFLSRNG